MDMRRRPVTEAASWCNVAYPIGGDVVDPVFNRVRLMLSVCPSSAVAVRVAVRESVVMSVRLDPHHIPVSSGVCLRGDMYSGGISIEQFVRSALNHRNISPWSGLVKKPPIMSSVGQCLTVSQP